MVWNFIYGRKINMANQFIMPGQIFYGEGALEQAAASVAGFGRKALVVTDSVMVRLGNIDTVTGMLGRGKTVISWWRWGAALPSTP